MGIYKFIKVSRGRTLSAEASDETIALKPTLVMAGIMFATLLCPFRPGDRIRLERPHSLPSLKKRDGTSPILPPIEGSWPFARVALIVDGGGDGGDDRKRR